MINIYLITEDCTIAIANTTYLTAGYDYIRFIQVLLANKIPAVQYVKD